MKGLQCMTICGDRVTCLTEVYVVDNQGMVLITPDGSYSIKELPVNRLRCLYVEGVN